eukprot:397395-Alexandrium_andersonii.AAC.1
MDHPRCERPAPPGGGGGQGHRCVAYHGPGPSQGPEGGQGCVGGQASAGGRRGSGESRPALASPVHSSS